MGCESLLAAYQSFAFILLLSATVIMLVLYFSTRRKNVCLECCGGRPGLYSPVDLLHRGPHRLIYAAIFGAMSETFLGLALSVGSGAFCTSTNPYQNAFCTVVINNVVLVFFICLLYGPVFSCVNTTRPLLGHVTGLLYLLLLITTIELINATFYSGCGGIEYDKGEIVIAIMGFLPSYTIYVILVVWFIYEIVNDVIILKTGSGIVFTHRKNAYLFKYTRQLLSKKEQLPIENGRWQKLKSFFWVYEKGFRFPLRLLAPLVVMVSLNFKLFFFGVSIARLLSNLIADVENVNNINHIAKGTIALGILAGFVAMGTCGVLLLQFVATVHKHLNLAAQGKFKFYSKSLPSHAEILVSALKYGGYQIGYFAWAWLIFWTLALIVFGLIAALFVGLVLFPHVVGPSVFKYALALAWIPVVLVANRLMCKFVFLESDSGGKFLAITNRNGFNCFSYFVFLYNGIVGVVVAIIRVLLSLVFGTLLLFRLDQNIMMDGFQFADMGHKIYLGFLYLEHTYNNPVANTFVALLIDGNDKEGYGDRHSLKRPVRSQRARNRWLVAYTLINNPGLCPLRAPQLQARGVGGEGAGPEKIRVTNEYETMAFVHGAYGQN